MKPYYPIVTDINISERNVLDTRPCKPPSKPFVIPTKIWRISPLLLLALHLEGTTVAVVRTPAYVIIGVDSKITITSHEGNMPRVRYSSTCKVIRRGPAVYVGAGFVSGLIEAINGSRYPSEPLKALIAIREKLRSSLTDQIPLVRAQEPAHYASWVSGHPILMLFIAWPGKGIAEIHFIRFSLAPNGHDLSVVDGPSILDPKGQIYYYRDDAGPNPVPKDWFSRDHVDVVRGVVESGISANPASSGPPIAIIRVTPGGTNWNDGERGKCSQDASNALQVQP
jgi:hypothetical protein